MKTDIQDAIIAFLEENWTAFTSCYEDRTGEQLIDDDFQNVANKIREN